MKLEVVVNFKNDIINEWLYSYSFRSDILNTNLLGCNQTVPNSEKLSVKLYPNFVNCDTDIHDFQKIPDKLNTSVLRCDTGVPKNEGLIHSEDSYFL